MFVAAQGHGVVRRLSTHHIGAALVDQNVLRVPVTQPDDVACAGGDLGTSGPTPGSVAPLRAAVALLAGGPACKQLKSAPPVRA